MKKVAFYTLGCKLNFSETSSISRLFEQHNYIKAEFHEKADIYVINTCSVTENADKKCRKVVREALRNSPGAFIAIIGCYAQLKPEEISGIPGVDAVLGASEKFRLIELLGSFEKKEKAEVYASPIETASSFNNAFSAGDRTRAFLKIQDGCDYSCSFCTIPLARGKSRSDTIDNIIRSTEEIALREVKEIVITGVNIGDYGIIEGKREASFFDLIKKLDQVEGIERFRISSIEPNLLTNEVIQFTASSDKFMPHFHIPLQSGSNKILALMRRRYKRELYAERVAAIKSVMPHACIGVDVITGFPGETEEDFTDTYNFLNDLDISYLHVFTYSERDNTQAISLPGIVPQGIRNQRTGMLRILSEKKRRYFYETHLGSSAKILFEADQEEGMMQGFSENYIRVTAKYDPVLVNEIREVSLIRINEKGLVEIEEVPELLHHNQVE